MKKPLLSICLTALIGFNSIFALPVHAAENTTYRVVSIPSEGFLATNHYQYTGSFEASNFAPRALRGADSDHYVSSSSEDVRKSIPYVHLSEWLDAERNTGPVTRVEYIAGYPEISAEGLRSQSYSGDESQGLYYNIAHVPEDVELVWFGRLNDGVPAHPEPIDATVTTEFIGSHFLKVTLDTKEDLKAHPYIGLRWKYGEAAQAKVNELGDNKIGAIIALDSFTLFSSEPRPGHVAPLDEGHREEDAASADESPVTVQPSQPSQPVHVETQPDPVVEMDAPPASVSVSEPAAAPTRTPASNSVAAPSPAPAPAPAPARPATATPAATPRPTAAPVPTAAPKKPVMPVSKKLTIPAETMEKAMSLFSDVAPTHWAQKDIAFVVKRGLFSGIGKDTFAPDQKMTRGMFVTVLGKLAQADVAGAIQEGFSDVSSARYDAPYIQWATKNGIVSGTGKGVFNPDQAITREQMLAILLSYARAMRIELPDASRVEPVPFADAETISAWARPMVDRMRALGVINGKTGNRLDPKGTATRAEVSAVLKRYIEQLIENV